MKKILAILVLVSIYSCSSTKSTTSSSSSVSTVEVPKANSDGSSMEKAIVIKAKNEQDGVRAEYVMLGKLYPDFRLKSQGTSGKNAKSYDIMTIITADGTEKVIYFDITNFYGKF